MPNNRVDKNMEKESFLEFPPHNYFVNQSIFNDFSKYDILNLLEEIVEKGMAKDGSQLSSAPKQTIKKLIYSYQSERSEVLRKLKELEE